MEQELTCRIRCDHFAFHEKNVLVRYLCGTLDLFIIITQYGSTGYIGMTVVCVHKKFFHLQLAVIWTLDATCSRQTGL